MRNEADFNLAALTNKSFQQTLEKHQTLRLSTNQID